MNKTALLLTIALSPLPLAAEPLQFNWQQTRATVTETVTKNNTTVQMRYNIELQPQKDGIFLLRYHDHELLSVNGQQAEQLKKMAFAMMLLAPTPDLLVGTGGEPLDIPDWENYYAKLLNLSETLSKQKDSTTLLQNPALSSALKLKSMQNPWCAWVCLWANKDPKNLPPPTVYEEQVLSIPVDLNNSYQLLNSSENSITLRFYSTATIRRDKPLSDSSIIQNAENRKAWHQPKELGNQTLKYSMITATLNRYSLQPQRVELFTKQAKKQAPEGVEETTSIYEFKWD